MSITRTAHLASRLLPLLASPVGASAQTAGGDASGATLSPAMSGGSVAILAVVLVTVLAIGVAIKLYDLKRKRDDEVLLLQSQVSDALLLEPLLVGVPIAAFARGSLWRRSSVVVAVTGPVPTPEVRDAVMRLVKRELARRHPGARAEDRIVIDPLVVKPTIRTLSTGPR